MSLKDRTKKRLRWFIGGIVVLLIGGTGAYITRDRIIEHRAVAGRGCGVPPDIAQLDGDHPGNRARGRTRKPG